MRATAPRSQFLSMLLMAAVCSTSAQAPAPRSWNFDGDKPGAVAAGFRNDVGEWKVVAQGSAPSRPHAFAQLAKSERPIFNVALATETSYQNVDITVQLMASAGVIDQGGGVVWRAQDAQNYYIARFNPLENNYRVYKVVGGQRTQLGTAEVQAREGWYTLRVVMKGEAITCYLDGKPHLEVRDGTFPNPGRIGLWTKADAQTLFDNLAVRAAQ